jgi:hypothetical protein
MHADISAFVASPLTFKSISAVVSNYLPALAHTTGLLFRSSNKAFSQCSTPAFEEGNHQRLIDQTSTTSMQLQQRSSLQAAGRPHAAKRAAVVPIRAHLASATPIASRSHAPVSVGLGGRSSWSSLGALPFAASPLQHRSVHQPWPCSSTYACIARRKPLAQQ